MARAGPQKTVGNPTSTAGGGVPALPEVPGSSARGMAVDRGRRALNVTIVHRPYPPSISCFPTRAVSLLCAVAASGCTSVGVHQHRLVSKPAMAFEESTWSMNRSALLFQLEPGLASSGGAQAGACSSCK